MFITKSNRTMRMFTPVVIDLIISPTVNKIIIFQVFRCKKYHFHFIVTDCSSMSNIYHHILSLIVRVCVIYITIYHHYTIIQQYDTITSVDMLFYGVL